MTRPLLTESVVRNQLISQQNCMEKNHIFTGISLFYRKNGGKKSYVPKGSLKCRGDQRNELLLNFYAKIAVDLIVYRKTTLGLRLMTAVYKFRPRPTCLSDLSSRTPPPHTAPSSWTASFSDECYLHWPRPRAQNAVPERMRGGWLPPASAPPSPGLPQT